ncbi:BZ3500_MvSof-1268-A1-R1_Chr2-2g05127 [Microbotryum saponariae]|uniref:BZ3500_MvSof-1268-A1-R1_Chr2-2g05127 protein n=1 Tax=Microbotryum saponariae TaxID=289078 RepID=A0A2X0KNL6_9BASI|nr:BZ3500_MvSof-1268-A1-R1_Chr2-2g05127 [Microbotryum saponariae]SDA00954.1 BZ3501_MvSof-1269-A2-R1_Chr2-2g04801 [Microbotryum saponariae]
MSSWFVSAAPTGPNFAGVHRNFAQEAFYGPLVQEDTEWLCAGGFVTETQTFYATTEQGELIMCQVIHSSVGVWYPSIQFTFRYVNPTTSKHVWKSTAVTNFTVGGAKLDKRSSKSDQFTITVDPSKPNVYTIQGKYDDETQISLTYEALTPGWKLGAGPRGGMSYFGQLKPATTQPGTPPDLSGGADGYCVHRFWPRCAIKGILRLGTDVIQIEDARGTFIHAIQGMRPNVLASAWNFANFQSPASGGEGVALTMMEFTSCPAYGSHKVNIGSIVVGDKLVAVVAGGDGIQGGSVALHYEAVNDVETGYDAPGAIKYTWEGLTLSGEGDNLKPSASSNDISSAEIDQKLLTSKPGEPYATQGLVEKVDVLGQIPYLLKKFVNYAAGTKPYIYTWLNPVDAKVVTPGQGVKTVKGTLFSEATFVS